ncbi:MAG: flavin reductase family protein [Gammaproteobacteria bacterium]|nr:flavin reductase family protein [Gammaproteobacteria bacterium]
MAENTEETALVRAAFLDAMSRLAAGVTVVATDGPGGLTGQTVSAFTSISADPPTVLVCLNHDSSGCAAVTENGCFSVNVLGSAHTELSNAFAGRTDEDGAERFKYGDWHTGASGAPVLDSAIAVLECKVSAYHDVATHRVFIGTVTAATSGDGAPLIYAQRSYSIPQPI